MIYSTLKRGPWRKKPPRPGSPKREMYEERIRRAQAAKDRDRALTWGCEYSSVFLLAVYKLHGCAACSRHDPTGPHRHHVIHRSRKGRAESLVVLCPRCHTEDGRGVERKAKEDHGVDLWVKARDFAAVGTCQGWLPPEMCEACGTWHSARLMLDDVDQRTGITRRICAECAPEGPI